MKSRTDEMNNEEFLAYVRRVLWKHRTTQAGSGLFAGSCAAYLLAFPVVACALPSAVGICLLLIAAHLHLTEPAFIPLAIDEELTEEERVKRVFLSDLEIM
ncbi:hypothetical protein [Sinorhizobium medicae]|uniref:hypothetical protein n=1 Tax=Sinorhizobium medicae TaxID=110321 RepID=UPI000FD3C0FD|nr:hypothetical protein [Sinorhizobium medicae]MDX0759815.1 hypothetical protein [Sinorhizobium medicae]MDX0796508.1 hypothetical protein [Sinorhizobium medicae]MDX0808643.1 hypothetical protein [Sinorhizobium medicae]MDX1158459.1 hypothetical protein [Sinorhizobium medicae]RVJ03375.1 hypothetical protein CN181_24995 [Sinorhizobium medicae]